MTGNSESVDMTFLRADTLLLLLLIPFQIIVYFAGGEMIFVYLRDKKLIGHISRLEQTRIALEYFKYHCFFVCA